MNKFLFYCVTLILLVVFVYYSASIDQYIAHLPFNTLTNKFYGAQNIWCSVVYHAIPWVTGIIATTCLVHIAFCLLSHNNTRYLPSLIIIVSLVLGPGLIVNSLLKSNWGRPRPYQVLTIKHNVPFSPVWKINFAKRRGNNSFASGHAAIGFFCGVPLLVFGYRRLGLLVSLITGTMVGLVRILEGGHYFSDVLFAFFIVWSVAECTNYLIRRFLSQKLT